MADYTKQIFEMLGVEPEEEFRASYKGHMSDYLFRFLDDLTLEYKYKNEWLFTSELKDFLNGSWKILKNHPTAEEQLAIDYARACGCKWIAKNKDRQIIACSCRPRKDEINGYWVCDGPSNLQLVLIELEISFIHWEDEEPYEIEQKRTEEKEVCKCYSGGECMAQKYHPTVECKGDKSCCERDN